MTERRQLARSDGNGGVIISRHLWRYGPWILSIFMASLGSSFGFGMSYATMRHQQIETGKEVSEIKKGQQEDHDLRHAQVVAFNALAQHVWVQGITLCNYGVRLRAIPQQQCENSEPLYQVPEQLPAIRPQERP